MLVGLFVWCSGASVGSPLARFFGRACKGGDRSIHSSLREPYRGCAAAAA
jgi:hypothetical protein